MCPTKGHGGSGVITGLSLNGIALAFGKSYQVVAVCPLADLMGNVQPAPGSISTLPDPGLLAQDGFEGPLSASQHQHHYTLDAARVHLEQRHPRLYRHAGGLFDQRSVLLSHSGQRTNPGEDIVGDPHQVLNVSKWRDTAIMANGDNGDAIPPEREIQNWLEARLADGSLLSAISDVGRVAQLERIYNDPYFLPEFPVDSYVRRHVVEAAGKVLAGLGLLDVISATRNISATAGEKLMPDVLAVNPETGSMVLFEIKRSRQTARETTTELLAYEHEVKNVLPFLSSADVLLVVVATEYSVLLEHSLAALIAWERKNILCLLARPLANGGYELAVHLPSAWQSVGQLGLPGDTLRTITLVMSPKRDARLVPEDAFSRVSMALDLVCREGDRIGSHGFALAWRDTYAVRDQQCYRIMVGEVNPYGLLQLAFANGLLAREDGALVKCLAGDMGSDLSMTGTSVRFAVCKQAKRLLEESFDVVFENDVAWPDAREELRFRGHVEEVDFWGGLGDYIRDLWLRPAYRDVYNPAVAIRGLSWRNPWVGVTLLDDLSALHTLTSRGLGCEACFGFGKKLRYLCLVAETIAGQPGEIPPGMEAVGQWAQLDMASEALELAEICRRRIGGREPPLLRLGPLTKEKAGELAKNAEALVKWTQESLLDPNSPQRAAFDLGQMVLPLVNEYVRCGASPSELAEVTSQVTNLCRNMARACLRQCTGRLPEVRDQVEVFARIVLRVSGEIPDVSELETRAMEISVEPTSRSLKALLSLADALYVPAAAVKTEAWDGEVDWDWLKERTVQAWAAGERYPAIIRESSGQYGVGRVGETERNMLEPVSEPWNDVFVIEVIHGGGTAVNRTTWEQLAVKWKNPVGRERK